MKKIKNEVVLKRRVEKLIALGFEPQHEDSSVWIDSVELMVDFSAIAEDHFLDYALKEIANKNFNNGRDYQIQLVKESLCIN